MIEDNFMDEKIFKDEEITKGLIEYLKKITEEEYQKDPEEIKKEIYKAIDDIEEIFHPRHKKVDVILRREEYDIIRDNDNVEKIGLNGELERIKKKERGKGVFYLEDYMKLKGLKEREMPIEKKEENILERIYEMGRSSSVEGEHAPIPLGPDIGKYIKDIVIYAVADKKAFGTDDSYVRTVISPDAWEAIKGIKDITKISENDFVIVRVPENIALSMFRIFGYINATKRIMMKSGAEYT